MENNAVLADKKIWCALVLAGPLVLFPFSRAYYIFYVGILAIGLMGPGLRALWRDARSLQYAFYAIALPMLLSIAVLLVTQHGWRPVWAEKVGVVALACLLGLATRSLARDDKVTSAACLIMAVVIGTWVLDGLLQVAQGHSIDCRTHESPCAMEQRLSLYFAGQTKLGYYLGMLVFLPVAWLISQRRVKTALALLAGAGFVVMAGGSRFGMLSFLIGCLTLSLVATWSARPVLRLAVLVVVPLAICLSGVLFYELNPSFQSRVAYTVRLFQGLDYETVNIALSGRLDIWAPLTRMIADHWLIGVGPGDLYEAMLPYIPPENPYAHSKIFHSHQVILDIGAATGIIGVLAFLAFYGWVVWQFIRASAEGVNVRWAGLLVFLLMWFPVNSAQGFYASELVFLTFYMLGLGFRSGGDAVAGPAPGASAGPASTGSVVV